MYEVLDSGLVCLDRDANAGKLLLEDLFFLLQSFQFNSHLGEYVYDHGVKSL